MRTSGGGGLNMQVRRWLVVAALFAFAAIAMGADSCGSTSGGGGDKKSDTTSGKSVDKKKSSSDCGTKATDDCTPHVGPGGKVRVDALDWRVLGASSTKAIGDQQLGLGAKADGVFIVVKLQVHSNKTESDTITDESIQLEVPGGNTYKSDSDGTVAALGAGQKPLFLEDIGPDSTLRSEVVFDVPPKVLKKKIEVRFNELGFGSTHGYIKLPL
jgi:hypothetical protein